MSIIVRLRKVASETTARKDKKRQAILISEVTARKHMLSKNALAFYYWCSPCSQSRGVFCSHAMAFIQGYSSRSPKSSCVPSPCFCCHLSPAEESELLTVAYLTSTTGSPSLSWKVNFRLERFLQLHGGENPTSPACLLSPSLLAPLQLVQLLLRTLLFSAPLLVPRFPNSLALRRFLQPHTPRRPSLLMLLRSLELLLLLRQLAAVQKLRADGNGASAQPPATESSPSKSSLPRCFSSS